MSGDFGNTALFDKYNEVINADITECRAHFRENSAHYYSALEKYCKHLDTSQPQKAGLPEELVKEIEALEPDLSGLKATLRSYQLFGVKYAIHQKRTLLGDEMGLGKTIQAISAIIAQKAAGKYHFMVVCPASVLINWCREIQKFSDLEVTKIHGNDEAALRYWRENGDVAVTTYESISRFELPEKFTFDYLMAIRQVSWQVSDLKDSSKAMRLLEICESAKEQGRKVIVLPLERIGCDTVFCANRSCKCLTCSNKFFVCCDGTRNRNVFCAASTILVCSVGV